MAIPKYCHHTLNLLKSESTLIQWTCSQCYSGPHWYIYECKYCKLKTCRPCADKAWPMKDHTTVQPTAVNTRAGQSELAS
ncbi:uncharacterized protein RAG0_03059 [Rhynchosporium agropyri]|uniref:Uncharacterized protein n=1 Tax=Rhynchosporium agropyri TaxID=914238 RepID=A0A1E1K2X9_9HELO|nr:uncharacterized protein RAG0_03059 [Rhynchosporium agropyri]